MCFLAKIAFEAFDGIMCQEDVDVCIVFDHLSCKRVLVRCKDRVEAEAGNVDGCPVEVELL